MTVRRDQPYLYPTWLAKLMAGDVSCEWAVWYRVHHRDWSRPPSDFDQAKYNMEHTKLLREVRLERDTGRERLLLERQASFWYTHPSGIRLSGTPDLVSLSERENCIYEAKAFTPRAYHRIQVLIYMYCMPRSENVAYYGKSFAGQLRYQDHSSRIEPDEITGQFEEQFNFWMDVLATEKPLEKFPSAQECRFCNIGKADCPERLADAVLDEG
jgi:hypothetical protein